MINKKKILMVATTLLPRMLDLVSSLSSEYEIHISYVAYPPIIKMLEDTPDNFYHWPIQCPSRIFSLAETKGFDRVFLLPVFRDMLTNIMQIRKQIGIDIIHCHDVIPSGFIVSLCNRKLPMIIGLRGSDIKVFGHKSLYTVPIKYTLERSTRIIALSNDLEQEAVRLGADKNNIQVIPGGINTDKFKPVDKPSIRKKLDLPEGKIILFVGNLVKLKRIDALIKIFENLRKKHKCHLLILGEGPEKERLVQFVDNLGVPDVIIKGRIPFHDMPGYVGASDILVLPSESEGLPDCVQEAMACGIPVVTSNVGGLPEIVRNGENGYLTSNDFEMEKSLEALITSDQLLDSLGKNAREFALKNLSIEMVVKQIKELYDSLS